MLPFQPSTAVTSDIEIVPDNYIERLDPSMIFGRAAPLEVDLGCGDGSFLVALAEADPNRDYLGIERLRGRVRRTHGKIVRGRLPNARVFWIETSYAIQYMLPPESVTVFHLMFPDPWPKRRHWPRRIINGDFLGSISRALVPSGLFRIVTDQIDYFLEVERLVNGCVELARTTDESTAPGVSTFEKRFREQGLDIHSLTLRKRSPVT